MKYLLKQIFNISLILFFVNCQNSKLPPIGDYGKILALLLESRFPNGDVNIRQENGKLIGTYNYSEPNKYQEAGSTCEWIRITDAKVLKTENCSAGQGANYGITIDDIHKEIFLRVTVRNKNGKEKAINSVAHWVLNIEAKIESLQAIDLSGALVSYNEKSIDIKLPSGSTKSSLKVKYSLSLGAKMTGKTCCEFVGDFTNPVTLTIIAEEGTISADYSVTVNVGIYNSPIAGGSQGPANPTLMIKKGFGTCEILGHSSLTLQFYKASDLETSANNLQYNIYYNNTSTGWKNSTDLVWISNVTNYTLSNLTMGTIYNISIVVKDGDGNEVSYNSLQKTTLAANSIYDNCNGTVTDLLNGVLWMKCSMGRTTNPTTNICEGSISLHPYCSTKNNACNNGSPDWTLNGSVYDGNEIYNKCDTLILDGITNWRVPNKQLLQNFANNVYLQNLSLFDNLSGDYFWTSEAYPSTILLSSRCSDASYCSNVVYFSTIALNGTVYPTSPPFDDVEKTSVKSLRCNKGL